MSDYYYAQLVSNNPHAYFELYFRLTDSSITFISYVFLPFYSQTTELTNCTQCCYLP